MHTKKSTWHHLLLFGWLALGGFLAAFSLQVFFIPNRLIDGGTVGLAMIAGNLSSPKYIPYFIVAFNLPFLYLAYRNIGKTFVIQMLFSVCFFAGFMIYLETFSDLEFKGDPLEVVVIGGAILGVGLGLIIRHGSCIDGTEILGVIINQKTGFTVGQTVLFCNIFVFGGAGLVFQDWHPPILSLITYMVAIKVMDTVIIGLDETKSVLIISSHSKQIAEAIIHELGLGLTIMYGRGGFSGDEREILYVIAERLQLAELKELIHREDPSAFIAIENLHEVANGNKGQPAMKKKTRIEKIISVLFLPKGS
jgi:uncharacterized membrane-anchored protein YitT (DUF2179 family)